MSTVDALAADGGIVRLRPVAPDDAGALRALYGRGSVESLRRRFFGQPSDAVLTREVERLTRPPSSEHDAVVAEYGGAVVGVASYERMPGDEQRAEFAVFVDDTWHGRGVGTLLLEHLVAQARTAGYVELVGEVLRGNAAMMQVAVDMSGRARSRFGDGVVDVGLSTVLDEAAAEAIDARDRTAERASLRPLLRPRVVAVVGAGRQPGGIGHETLTALVSYGFTGRLYAVNPNADAVAGVPAYPGLAKVPELVDLAVVAVPAAAVPAALADAAAAGVRAAVVLSSGLGETGEQGQVTQARLVEQARAHGIRLVGPNCLGVLNSEPDFRLAATFAPVLPPAGGLAVASQSGAVGIALLDHAARTGLGISSFVSLGNKADVSGNDLLAYWFDDPATHAVALYLESFGNPRKFARVARALARRKPVIAVFSGRSGAGQRAGASHTAAAASPAVAVDTLFAQAGVVRVDHLGDLIDAARMLTDQPLPSGPRLAVVGNAGGVNVLAADAAEAHDLTVAEASPELAARLGRLLPGAASVRNPLDLGAGASPAAFANALDLLLGSGEYDSVLVVAAATRANDVTAIVEAAVPVLDRYRQLTAAVVVLGAADPPVTIGHRRAPVFDLPERAVRALSHATGYAHWRRQALGERPVLSDVDTGRAGTVVAAGLADGGGWQPYGRIAELLSAYGIPVLPSATVHSGDDAVEAARRFGYPVVLKAADPGLVHKSDRGGVRLRLGDPAQVRAAYADLAATLGEEVLVQPTATGSVELVAGIVHDRLFGSLVMLGLGGVHTDLFGDRAFRLVPVTDLDARHLWQSLRAAPLLTGYRGAQPVATAAVEDLLLRVARLAEEHPEVAELDLNPVIAGPHGLIAVDAKLRLAEIGDEPQASLRRLRAPG